MVVGGCIIGWECSSSSVPWGGNKVLLFKCLVGIDGSIVVVVVMRKGVKSLLLLGPPEGSTVESFFAFVVVTTSSGLFASVKPFLCVVEETTKLG